MNLENCIRRKGRELGFDLVGITTAEPLEPVYADYHRHWLEAGCAAKMGYLHRNNDKRFAPARLLSGAQSVICVALNYRPRNNELPAGSTSAVSRYGLYDDYHTFIKSRLFDLAAFVRSASGEASPGFKVCTDAIPLAERALARRAGLGFIGRNHALIHPKLGGMLFLGELLTTLPLAPDAPLDEQDYCGDCGQCIAACPTGALGADGLFDARKCLSYLTIEEPGQIDECFGETIGGCLFGCDACLAACPYENDAPSRANVDMVFHPERIRLSAREVLGWTQADFEALFKGSVLERLGLDRLKRNARLCLSKNEGNKGANSSAVSE